MRSLLLLSAFLIYSSNGFAEFLNPITLPFDLNINKFENIKKSVFRFLTKGNACTATFISEEGVFVTSMHCFEECLKDPILKHVQVVQTIDGASQYALDQERIRRGGLFCTIKPEGEKFQTAYILASGRGFIDKDFENKVLALNNTSDTLHLNYDVIKKMRQAGFGPADDFIIAQIKSNHPRVCQSLQNTKKVQIYDSVWTVGYPSKAAREFGRGSDGISMQLSLGQVNQTILQNPCVSYSSDLVAKEIQKYQDIPGMMWTTLDSAQGASGSPVLNPSGQIVGILTSVSTNRGADKEYCSGGTSVLKLETILERLQKVWSEEEFNSNLKCKNNEFQKGNL